MSCSEENDIDEEDFGEENSKNEELTPLLLQVIPPSVVITKILVFVGEVDLSKKNITNLYPVLKKETISEKERNEVRYSLFGIFKRDFTRKIFFLFPSLKIEKMKGTVQKHFMESFPVVDVRRVFSLKLKKLNEKVLPSKMFEAEGMKELQNLGLSSMGHLTGEKWTSMSELRHLNFYDLENFTDTFFQHFEFPKLKTLDIFRSERIEGRKWKCGFQNSIIKIDLSYSSVCDELFQNFEFKNLKELTFGGGSIIGRNWKPMKKLDFLSIYGNGRLGDEFFKNQPFENLERLLLEDMSGFDGRWNKEFKKLDELKMINVDVDDNLFKSNHFPVLDELNIFCGQTRLTGIDWNEMPKMDVFSTGKDFPNLEEIKRKFPSDCEVNLY